MERQASTKEQDRKRERILITGARGTIGSVLTQSLIDDFELIEFDKEISDSNKGQFKVDIADLQSLEKIFQQIGAIDAIVHLAANPNADAPWKEVLQNNIIGTKNIYECARKYNVKRVIFASSTHLYGSYEGYPQTSPLGRTITANDPPRPDGDYGVGKGFGELLARQYYDLYGIQSICIRIGSVSDDDKPTPPYEKLWLSHQDVSDVFRKALMSNVPFGIYFAISNNTDPIFDTNLTKRELGFYPQGK